MQATTFSHLHYRRLAIIHQPVAGSHRLPERAGNRHVMQFALTGLGECNGSTLTAIGQRYFSNLVRRRRPAPAARDGAGYLFGSQAFLERVRGDDDAHVTKPPGMSARLRSEEHTSELQSRPHLVCRLLLEKKKKIK